MAVSMKTSEVNHLRRLLGWIRCEIGQSPSELTATLNRIKGGIPDTEFARNGIRDMMIESYRVPRYVRDAIKMLEPLVREAEGNIVDARLADQKLPRTMIELKD